MRIDDNTRFFYFPKQTKREEIKSKYNNKFLSLTTTTIIELTKDPGVPNLKPLKQQMMNSEAARKSLRQQEALRQKQQRQEDLTRRRSQTQGEKLAQLISKADAAKKEYDLRTEFESGIDSSAFGSAVTDAVYKGV